MPTCDLASLLQDHEVKERIKKFLASKGGSARVAQVRCRFLAQQTGEGIPYSLARAYFRALPADFILAGSNEVALTHTAAATVEVKHRANQRRPLPAAGSSQFVCKLCRTSHMSAAEFHSHVGGAKHRVQHAVSLIKQQGVLLGDREGVEVSRQALLAGLAVGQSVSTMIMAFNSNSHSVSLLRFGLLRRTPGVSVVDERGHAADTVNACVMPCLSAKTFTITFTPQAVGVLLDVLVLEFDGFSMMRELTADCEPQLGPGLPSIAPTAPFVKKAPQRFTRQAPQYEKGEAPPRSRHEWKNPPGHTAAPQWLEDMVADGKMGELETMLSMPTPTMSKFVRKLQNLLWLEEMQHEVDIRQYDMEGVTMQATRGRHLILQVPGLAENRPSVMRGDALYVRKASGGQEYQGYVHQVCREEVFLRFNENFHSKIFTSGMPFNVRFAISRSTFVFMQAALLKSSMNTLHPATLMGAAGLPNGSALGRAGTLPGEPTWTLNNPINEEQKTAVRSIISGAYAPLPYLIFGPPGTGKTMTMTEAAVQLYRMKPESRLLLTAPSNSAADQLALRVLEKGVPPSAVMRVCAYSRPKDDMPATRFGNKSLLDLSNWDDGEGAFLLEPALLSTILSKRVMVCTCLMAAKLHALGVSSDHFTHVCIDEAGHAEEPLSLAAMSGLLPNKKSARLILAGDPKQLGPVILSPLAKRLGLATSAMERLISVEPYMRQDSTQAYNTTFITKLVNNYRSHPDLLRLPNRLFYDNELLAMAHRDHTHSLLGFTKLPNRNFPIIFHAVVGRDEREASSPSWFNQMEAKLILEYVIALQDMRANRPSLGDIGVISPYRKQVQKVRALLTAKYGNIVKVGSVEEFQGQERRAILISTVRSSAEHLEMDAKHRLGFLANPKRFNVALTRAKSLLVVVGNPAVLCTDPHWMGFLAYCFSNNACTGSAMPPEVVEAARSAGSASSGPTSSTSQGSLWDSVAAMAERLLKMKITDTSEATREPSGFMYTAPIQVEGGEMRKPE